MSTHHHSKWVSWLYAWQGMSCWLSFAGLTCHPFCSTVRECTGFILLFWQVPPMLDRMWVPLTHMLLWTPQFALKQKQMPWPFSKRPLPSPLLHLQPFTFIQVVDIATIHCVTTTTMFSSSSALTSSITTSTSICSAYTSVKKNLSYFHLFLSYPQNKRNKM